MDSITSAVDSSHKSADGTSAMRSSQLVPNATEDRTVHPDLERFAAKRMGATTVELKSSHVPMLSQPGFVLDVIRKAAKVVQNR